MCRRPSDDARSRARTNRNFAISNLAIDCTQRGYDGVSLKERRFSHTQCNPYHPMTQGKIGRWHLSLKSQILLENNYLPGDLERSPATFIDRYNHRRCDESPDNLKPEDVYFGPGQRNLDVRMEVKRKTIEKRRRRHSELAARTQTRW